MSVCGSELFQLTEQKGPWMPAVQMEMSWRNAQDSELLSVLLSSTAALAFSCFLCVSPDPFFFAFAFLNQSGAFHALPPPGSQHFSTVCPILEQFVHVAFIFFCMDFCCLAMSTVHCFERASHVHVSCAFVSMQAMMLAEVSDLPDVVRKLIRFSLSHSCSPSRAWRRNTIVQSS